MLLIRPARMRRWIKDIEAYTTGSIVNYPIICDPNRDIATLCATVQNLPSTAVAKNLHVHAVPQGQKQEPQCPPWSDADRGRYREHAVPVNCTVLLES